MLKFAISGKPSINNFVSVCPESRWGENCSRTCGQCAGGNCNAQTGTCSGGCLPGYKDTALCKDGKNARRGSPNRI